MPLIKSDTLEGLIKANDLYRVSSTKSCYWFKDIARNEWLEIKQTEVEREEVVVKCKVKGVPFEFYDMLRDNRRVVDGVVCSIEPKIGHLNIFMHDEWLKPNIEEGKTNHCDPFFDILLTSIAGGRKSVKDHVEQMILHKIADPGDWHMQALTMYGNGSVGKGMLFQILSEVFKGNTLRALPNEAFAHNNSILNSKVLVFLDETKATEKEYNRLKFTVLNREIQTKVIHESRVTIDNLLWFFIAYNPPKGKDNEPPIPLVGTGLDGVDRRWYVIRHYHALSYWVEKSEDYQHWKLYGRFKTPKDYIASKLFLLTNRMAIQLWLNTLAQRHGLNPSVETVLSPDYELAVQESMKTGLEPQELLARFLFQSDYFTEFKVDDAVGLLKSIGGTKYTDVASLGKKLAAFVTQNDLKNVWYKTDSLVSIWRRYIKIDNAANKGRGMEEMYKEFLSNDKFRERAETEMIKFTKLALVDENGNIITDPTVTLIDWDKDEHESAEYPNRTYGHAIVAIDNSGQIMDEDETFYLLELLYDGECSLALAYQRMYDKAETEKNETKKARINIAGGITENDYKEIAINQTAGDFHEMLLFIRDDYGIAFRKNKATVEDMHDCHQLYKEKNHGSSTRFLAAEFKYQDIFKIQSVIDWLNLDTTTPADVVRLVSLLCEDLKPYNKPVKNPLGPDKGYEKNDEVVVK